MSDDAVTRDNDPGYVPIADLCSKVVLWANRQTGGRSPDQAAEAISRLFTPLREELAALRQQNGELRDLLDNNVAITTLREQVRALTEERDGFMGRLADANDASNRWQRRAETAERELEEALSQVPHLGEMPSPPGEGLDSVPGEDVEMIEILTGEHNTPWPAINERDRAACIRLGGRCSLPARDTKDKCPRCGSPAPHLHPAVQHEGEVEVCNHEFHSRPTNRTPVRDTKGVGDG